MADEHSNTIIRLADQSSKVNWQDVEVASNALANELRSKDDRDLHTHLGSGQLPKSAVILLATFADEPIGDGAHTLAAFEILRLIANLCMDHDPNRQQFLDANLQGAALAIVDRYSTSISASINELKVAKTVVGALLNFSLGNSTVRQELITLNTPRRVLALSTTLYPPGEWAGHPESTPLDSEVISYQWRTGLADWSWRAITELSDGLESSPLGVPDLQNLIAPMKAFLHLLPATSPLVNHPESREALVSADLESLEESMTLLEALSLDSEEVRLAIANSVNSPKEQSLLYQILDFVEKGDYPDYWKLDEEAEQQKRRKVLDLCKAGAIKAVISVAGENKAMDILWGNAGSFVSYLVNLIKTNANLPADSRRDDLIIAASLVLGNLARKDSNCVALLKEPFSLTSVLVSLLEPSADIKLKHAVAGLLKNLVQVSSNRVVLGKAGLLEQLSKSKLWTDQYDMAETVQVSAIGIAKHLCNGDLENTVQLFDGTDPTGFDQILALVSRSDSVIVTSEGTRVLAYCVKSLWRKDSKSSQENTDALRKKAMEAAAKPETVQALSNLLVRGQKHAILLHESIFALTLLASYTKGVSNVRHALLTQVQSTAPTGDESQAQPAPSTGLDVLKAIIQDTESKFQAELRSNACSLVGTVLRGVGDNSTEKTERATLIASLETPLRTLAAGPDVPEKLKTAAQWASDGI